LSYILYWGRDMKKIGIILILLHLMIIPLCAQSSAVIKETTGKVEVQAPGGLWTSAAVGMPISRGATISTGFGSRALIDLGNAILNVQPLTRLRLEELIEKEGTVQTDLFLRVGKVKAEVKSVSGLQQDFKLRSPVSTAAVRGTQFDYSGFDVVVIDGEVTYQTSRGQKRTYSAGEGGGDKGDGTASSGGDSKNEESGINPYTAGAGGESASRLPGASGLDPTAIITIVIPPEPW
jgi:hypothetical protein